MAKKKVAKKRTAKKKTATRKPRPAERPKPPGDDPKLAEGVEARTRGPWVTVSSIKRLLSSDDQCKWRAWFRAHFKHPKKDDDLTDWKAKHQKLLETRAGELRAQGWKVRQEVELRVRGDGPTVAGVIDILARKTAELLVVDAKTGKKRGEDIWQVRIYLAVLPFVQSLRLPPSTYGEVRYTDDETLVENTTESKRRIFELIREVGGDVEPPRVASKRECQWCDIPDCPDRIEEGLEGSAQGAF